jgi:hypothetical protein
MSLLEDLRDANETRLLGEVLARDESFWGLTEARLSALDPKPAATLERVGRLLARVRAARIALYPKLAGDDVRAFSAAWTPERARALEVTLVSAEQRLTEIGVAP